MRRRKPLQSTVTASIRYHRSYKENERKNKNQTAKGEKRRKKKGQEREETKGKRNN